jgi:hypothetical protein
MKTQNRTSAAKAKSGNPFFLSPESTVYIAANTLPEPMPELLPDAAQAKPEK